MRSKLVVYKIEPSVGDEYKYAFDKWDARKIWMLHYTQPNGSKTWVHGFGEDEIAAFMNFKRNSDMNVELYDIVLGEEL